MLPFRLPQPRPVTALSGLSDDFAQPLDFLSAGIIRRGDTLKGETTLNLLERIANNPVVGLNVRERLLPSEIRRLRGEIPDETFNALKKEVESDEITGALRGTVERFSLEKYIKAAQSDLKELREQILPALLKAPKVPQNIRQITPQAMSQIEEVQAARTAVAARAFDAEGVTRQLMADAERLGGDAKAVKALNKVDDEIVKARSRLVAAEDETNRELVELSKEFRRGADDMPAELQEKFAQMNPFIFDTPVADTGVLRNVNKTMGRC